MKVFNDLATYNQYLNLKEPLHPMMDSRVCKEAIPNFPLASGEIQVNLFKIALKKNFSGDIKYGKNRYKTDNGLMLFSEPGQVVSWDTLTFWDGYALVFHPDILKLHPVASKISRYKYFSYEVDDALFMTHEEAETITWLFTKIHLELTEKRGNSNLEVVLSLLGVVLSYAEVYYERQYGLDQHPNTTISSRIKLYLQDYYSNLSRPVKEVPTVSSIATGLNLSPNYLTDLLRAETGKSTVSLIHEFITEQAQILLLQTGMNVSDVAYHLGFSNFAYFSRLFKKVKGVSPLEFRNQGKG
ncbi:helix-turn-helix transcriptional regulator [Chitinophaga sp.]|uniref:helix-turn-helix domain-containing protein n=1 Tax=Chitinophaga sp. TaxID=1869181 RepID=UPI002F950E5A